MTPHRSRRLRRSSRRRGRAAERRTPRSESVLRRPRRTMTNTARTTTNCRSSDSERPHRCGWRRGVVVIGVRRMNEVNPRRARLVLKWVTVFGWVYHLRSDSERPHRCYHLPNNVEILTACPAQYIVQLAVRCPQIAPSLGGSKLPPNT